MSPGKKSILVLYESRETCEKTPLDKRIRVYAPFGKAPYTVRRLMERKGNILFTLKKPAKHSELGKSNDGSTTFKMTPPSDSNGNLKIALLTTSFPRFEGDHAGSFVYKYAQGLARLGYRVKALAPRDPQVTDNGDWCDVEVEYFKYFIPESFQTLAYGAGIVSRIKQNILRLFLIPFFMASFIFSTFRTGGNSDLIHACWAPAGAAALLVKFFKKIPVVINLWGSDFLLPRIPGFGYLLRILTRNADAVICESLHFKKRLTQFGIPEAKISVIPNGVDLEIFKTRDKHSARNQLALPKDKTMILNISGMSPVKGQKYLIEAIPEIIEENKTVRFVFIGDGETRKELESLVSARGLDPYVLFAGIQKTSQIPLWLNAADIFVLPSLSEGNPNVLLEAMASGLPIVATTVGGIPEMIRDGREGLTVSPKSPKSLARKITLLIRDKILRERLGQNGLKTVRENYGTWERQSEKLKAIYETLTVK